ncbi:Asp-tRNA(Asn)/Glu-tRNA(Gln) amidotransferase GatCAB subunit B [Putridiphycobacter roseus]|uniref:Aspartyl/glutamyl-tRNA(Asn/Gln) amidotransferase subunit B n=1 Tax=Putridiphycobacter roseus TaxID=2219161 RepID=A0A2W1NEV7_9FLAO|nr:Asp-tRNA(Asn)/Glu-tRNA(Gln) amidotransferase subunit GatB [Putridiphycobacter roseus]PZE17633.1 Asp-tRNA(Asn)/Glu-tRNA(Gln) amidotransferase GatCAB subunit B [Putridiphycobacter roseus]
MELSKEIRDKYQAVIGLEVHAQMLTQSKAYSSDANLYGAAPNTLVSPITLGHPGTLPKMNKATIDYAIKMGIACNCDITENQYFARKNYFYPDLPKGYQITQDTTPICTGGMVNIKTVDGQTKQIGLTRIHMEEDAGKSIHDIDPFNTLVDLNRAGVPLIEIVSEPEIADSTEAYNYVTAVRKLVRYLDICDGNMEEGSMRCDANISVMLKGSKEFGSKVEVKNMNSIRNVKNAIEFEITRQIIEVEKGNDIPSETRNYDAIKGNTTAMRSKEAANDYRFFPEPDLQPIRVTQEHIDKLKKVMPPLPEFLFEKYTQTLKLSDYDANNIIDTKEIALYFETMVAHTKNYKGAANWLMGEIKSYLNEHAVKINEFPISGKQMAALVNLIDTGKISNSIASQKVFPVMLVNVDKLPDEIAAENNWILDANEDSLAGFIVEIINENPDEIERFRAGDKKLMGLFMGQLMKKSKGKADPKSAGQLLSKMILK